MNAVVNRLLATKKAPQGAFFTPMGDLHNLPVAILFFRCGGANCAKRLGSPCQGSWLTVGETEG